MTFFASAFMTGEAWELLGLGADARDEQYIEAATRAIACNLAPIPNSLLLHLLGQRDNLGRTCLWCLFSQAGHSAVYAKVLAMAKMRWLSERLTSEAELARCAADLSVPCTATRKLTVEQSSGMQARRLADGQAPGCKGQH